MALLRWYEAQVSLTVAFSSSAFFGLLFLIFLLTILLTQFAYFDIVQCFVTICIVKSAI